ncbi:uncharacterized protein LOC128207277 [Mya arenaria]|uniref:uncharacterized protein LOC128207277 n=1 Tax=Mya arenaria TaxID=6604 RepID=UPI0022E81652|nr:uncharacterized protein LOC128207277 [Mya arenaria]
MVYKKSEYGRNYKISSLIQNIPVYEEHLNYRHIRRERECAHTPFSWDGEVESSDSDDKLTPAEEQPEVPEIRLADLAITEDEEEELPQESENESEDDIAKEKREAKEKDVRASKANLGACDVDIIRQNNDLRKSAKEKLNKYISKVNTDEKSEKKMTEKVLGKTFAKPKVTDEKCFVKRSKPRRPDRVGKLSGARPLSAPGARPKSAPPPATANERPVSQAGPSHPFYNYGGGAGNRVLGDKKTFNVRASAAVYPAALRAKKRNLLLVEQQQEKQRSASAREKRRKARFNERMSRQTAIWESEYRRSYPAYEDNEYATTERDPRKRKSQFTT